MSTCAQTCLAGVFRTPNAPEKLMLLYSRILNLMRKIPRDAAYKINTEAIVCHRLSIVNEAEGNVEEIEKNINCGNIEMLIRQAQDEYALLQRVMLWKPWERLVEKPPPGQWAWPPY